MKKVLHWLDENLECVLCMILLATFTVILFIQVVMRYVFNNSLSWSEELARYLFIWLIFLGISFGSKQMKHLRIDVFVSVFPKKIRPYVLILADAIVTVFAAIVVYSAYSIVSQYAMLGSKSPALKIPYTVIYSSALVGYALTLIRQIQAVVFHIKGLKQGDLSSFEHDEVEEAIHG